MIKSWLHRFLLWAPSALAAGVVAVSAVWKDVADWFALKFMSAWVQITDPIIAICILSVVALWIFLVIVTGEKKPEYESIESKIGDLATLKNQFKKSESIQAISGRMRAQEQGSDRLEAVVKTGLNGLYVGRIVASASRLKDEHVLSLALVGYNGSGEKIIFESLSGRIRAGSGTYRDMEELPPIALVKPVEVEAGKEFVINLEQPLSPLQTSQFLKEVETSAITFDLEGLKIPAASQSDRGKRGNLPLWDAFNLMRRDELVSNQVHVLKAEGILIMPETEAAV